MLTLGTSLRIEPADSLPQVRVRVRVNPNPDPDPDPNADPNPGTVNSTALDCALQYAGSTSPVLSGSLGVPTYPLLTRFEVDDPDNGDEEYGMGDVLVIGFDMDTTEP